MRLASLSGRIQKDENQNCLPDPTDPPLSHWLIEATDGLTTNYALTDTSGRYRLHFAVEDSVATSLALSIAPPNSLWMPCDSSKTITVHAQTDTVGIDFAVKTVVDCPLLDVSTSFWPARPCFPLTISADWCNLGTLIAPDAQLLVAVGPLVSVDSTSLPIASQSGDTLRFALGDVPLGGCGSVLIHSHLSCDAAIGQSVCVWAKVLPDSICAANPNWSGATLQGKATCLGDTVVGFEIRNIGTAPSTADLDYIVVEDQVLLFQGQVPSLLPNQAITFDEMADGSTFTLRGDQEPGHPTSQFYLAQVEGCGEPMGGGLPSFGWITPFLGDDGDPFSDEHCREASASYDPNLKEALPSGYGPEHLIEPGQSLTYTIQFQNTGNDTAFQVVLRDTISPLLGLSTMRVGAASHPFSYEIYGPGILKLIFKNIKLPDSTTNEAASHGWATFQIGQKAGLPLGTVIRNKAGIYFDFNTPVITNQTWHTLGHYFAILDWKNPLGGGETGLEVFPNPAADAATFRLEHAENQEFRMEIFLPDGRLVRSEAFTGSEFLLNRNGLQAGVYLIKITGKGGRIVGNGRFIMR